MCRMRLAFAGLLALAAVHPAVAADLPVRRAAPAPVPVAFSWTGFYFGVHVGGGWGTKEWTTVPFSIGGLSVPAFPFGEGSVNGILGGGQIGFNWQTGVLVLGVEADISWTNLEGRNTCIILVPFGNACRTEANFLGSITGRIGVTGVPSDRTMVYVKGGVGFIDEDHTIDSPFLAGLGVTSHFAASETRWGWTLGGGIEHSFLPNWSAKLEYQFFDFDTERLNFGSLRAGRISVPLDFDIEQHIHVIKLGLNYRFGFGAAPVVAAY